MDATQLVNRFYAITRKQLGDYRKPIGRTDNTDIRQECIATLLTQFHNGMLPTRGLRDHITGVVGTAWKALRRKAIPAQKCIHVYHVDVPERAATPERVYTVYGARPNRKHVQFAGYTIRDSVSLQTWKVTIPAQAAQVAHVRERRTQRAPDSVPAHYRYVRTDNVGYRKESAGATLKRPLEDILETMSDTDNVRAIVRLLGEGYRKGEIAKIIGMSERHVRRTLNRFKLNVPTALTLDDYPERAAQNWKGVPYLLSERADTAHLTYAKHDTYAYDVQTPDATIETWALDVQYPDTGYYIRYAY